ncbi:MAG TPA: hypothetical protein DD433_07840 [Ruminococcaceae bacterium]|jgi:hypothetical protein|nr:hypothetical protein [Oscillospiraceae bacterium]
MNIHKLFALLFAALLFSLTACSIQNAGSLPASGAASDSPETSATLKISPISRFPEKPEDAISIYADAIAAKEDDTYLSFRLWNPETAGAKFGGKEEKIQEFIENGLKPKSIVIDSDGKLIEGAGGYHGANGLEEYLNIGF